MAARDETTGRGSTGVRNVGNAARRLSTETKQFFKTSEFAAYVIVFIGILVAANVIENQGGRDFFTADKAWLYITILTLGYMLSRGIAKSGVREPYSGDDGRDDR
jgi:hypothetical protein